MSLPKGMAAAAEQCAKLAQAARTEADRARWLEMERFWRNKLNQTSEG
jgi:hypothetical protein